MHEHVRHELERPEIFRAWEIQGQAHLDVFAEEICPEKHQDIDNEQVLDNVGDAFHENYLKNC